MLPKVHVISCATEARVRSGGIQQFGGVETHPRRFDMRGVWAAHIRGGRETAWLAHVVASSKTRIFLPLSWIAVHVREHGSPDFTGTNLMVNAVQ